MDVPLIVTVCVCTFRRPDRLRRLLGALERQRTDGLFSYSVVISDNDATRSSEPVVAEHIRTSPLSLVYCCEPQQNIALARNKALEQASGDFIAFIDDDEFPPEDWLFQLVTACVRDRVAGVLGPVRPYFDNPPPGWVIKGRFCERPEHPTGRAMDWTECRTGNVLFRRNLIAGMAAPFDARFGTGGEDMDFFCRLISTGHVFTWCNEAPVYESVPPARLTRAYMLRRALLRGKNILKHSSGRARFILTSVAAVPVYIVVAPISAIAGHHHFMKYCIKLCDHAGRLLTLLGMNPISSRDV